MIPKKIHYCWFGGKEKPKLVKRCIDSWKKFCLDYEIIEWNEENFDIAKYPYVQYCFDNKKWAFLSDFVRLAVVYENGGIYFDTDVEVIKSFDDLLFLPAFYGFETNKYINTGHGFGAEKGNETVYQMMLQYLDLHSDENNEYTLMACPKLNTKALVPYGLILNGQKQDLLKAAVFPVEYFNPYDSPTGILTKTERTYSIHWYGKSWLSKWTVLRSIIARPFHRIFGKVFFQKVRR